MESDLELLEAWRRGDNQAGERLFDRYFDSVYRFFATKADQSDIDDLVQRTFLGCVEARDRFEGKASVRTYLLAIARNRLIDYWRSRERRTRFDFTVSSVEDLGPSPSGVMVKRQTDRLLLEALRRIPLDLQIAVELYYWEDLSGPALADVLGLPEGTVRSRIRRGLAALRERIAELAETPDLHTTERDLEQWARSLKEAIGTSKSSPG